MAEGKCHSILRIVQRKRVSKTERPESATLRRCLTSWDVTALGVGRTLGVGVYVLMGGVALNIAGPSVVLSFLIAALAALLAGLCYAEFGTRVPLAGSAYIYTYLSIGELVAFMVGWINILEFVFGAATIARSLSIYIDTVSNYSMSSWFVQALPLAGPPLSPHFDLFAFFLVLVFGMLLAVGVRESSLVNVAICAINLLFVLFIIIAGSVAADSANWSIPIYRVPEGYGVGRFFPYGVWGTIKGAAVCFYCFVGFDVVTAAAEEVQNPRVAIPTSIVAVISFVFLLYTIVSTVFTMMVPYYELAAFASISSVFSYIKWDWAWWIVNFGAFFGLSTSLYGALFPLPRLLFSMSSDGLLFPWFAKLFGAKRSPIIATIVPTIAAALLSGLFALDQLVLMLCVGTLVSYTLVAASVVLLRYRSNHTPDKKTSYLKQIFRRDSRRATRKSKLIIDASMTVYLCLCIVIAIVLVHTNRPLAAIIVLHVLAIFTVLVMALQPACDEELSFKTPLVPFLPCLSIYANIHLMVVLTWHSWVRFAIWLLIGIPIYLICLRCYKPRAAINDDGDEHKNMNGKRATVQIIVESPTPPDTVSRQNVYGNQYDDIKVMTGDIPVAQTKSGIDTPKTQEIVIQHIQLENSAEKEAKIIDLLDQVLQAEEDSYTDVLSLKESKSEDFVLLSDGIGGVIPHRKSLSELSDAGSDASTGNQVLSKYDVIAQVHREDLPKLREEEEESGNDIEEGINDYDEEITAFNESDTNSRTDESGYSDTLDRPNLGNSMEDTNISNIPVPPPFDESYFSAPIVLNFKKFNTVPHKHTKEEFNDFSEPRQSSQANGHDTNSNIPPPPPFDENYFKTPSPLTFKKFNTMFPPKVSTRDIDTDEDNTSEPRPSVLSNSSQGDGNIRFGSSRQISLASKLNDIFQKTINNEEQDEEPREKRRSQSTGNIVEAELAVAASRERPQMFLDLKKELLSRDSLSNLRPVNPEVVKEKPVESKPIEPEPEEEKTEMSRKELKSKLESIFAVGGPQLLAKPRLKKSNSATPDDSIPPDSSSTETESMPKLPKEKNDTLKRQKEKFSHVLNSIRLSMNYDENV